MTDLKQRHLWLEAETQRVHSVRNFGLVAESIGLR